MLIFLEVDIKATDNKAVGNHELNRHIVYQFSEANVSQVINVYYVPYRQVRELQAYGLLQSTGIPIAKILKQGTLLDNSHYIIMDMYRKVFLNAQILNERFSRATQEALRWISIQGGFIAWIIQDLQISIT
ncbi:hypothetical protein [Fusibacter sp. 3D3]|uniref:hypothetical protein n=1 Tax=Fusibacter sp. 3D3 TaxID=1048380 RepID=UPI0008534734|nr:hypothetical protein [Fusibacter sp. 3D3]GAU77525.1 hypothetical protein F3D3_2154 [Fusibacter sp. 3D3]